MKKFEEGIFSDLRNLKPGSDACLEEPKVTSLFPLELSPLSLADIDRVTLVTIP